MKTFLSLLFITISATSIAQWHTVKGNNNSKTETREASGYTSLEVGGPINVDIAYGNSNSIQLEGEDNLLPYIETAVKDNRLTIKVKDRYSLQTHQPIRVHVSMTTISALAQSGSGNINGDGNFSNDGNTSFSVSGSGAVKFSFASFGSLSLHMSGSGNVVLKGKVNDEIEVKKSGSGSANLEEAGCNTATVQQSGSGSVTVHVEKALTAQVSGSGSVFYSGNATLASKVSGSGRVKKV